MFLKFPCIPKEIGSRRNFSRQALTKDLRLSSESWMYKLPHKLLKDVGNSRKVAKFAQFLFQKNHLLNLPWKFYFTRFCLLFHLIFHKSSTLVDNSETLKYWVGVQQCHSQLMGRTCFFSPGWPSFLWCCHNKNTLWGRCFITSTSLAPHLFQLGWLKRNLSFLLDQLRLA